MDHLEGLELKKYNVFLYNEEKYLYILYLLIKNTNSI